MDFEFSGRRARALARISGYTLLSFFLLNIGVQSLPPPFTDPNAAMELLTGIIERSFLALLAIWLIYFGLSDAGLRTLWECRLAMVLRPILRLAPVLYLLVALAVGMVTHRIEARNAFGVYTEMQTSLTALQQIREVIGRAPDAAMLQKIIENQPALTREFDKRGVKLNPSRSLADQRSSLQQEIDRIASDVQVQALKRRADVSGIAFRQAFRLIAGAFMYGFFFFFAALVWPSTLVMSQDRIRQSLELDSEESDLSPATDSDATSCLD